MDEHVPKIKVAPNPDGHVAGNASPEAPRTILLSDDERQTAATGALNTQYQIKEKIGDGGMGVVYLARDKKLGRYVAIKRLNRASLNRPEIRERFFREAKAVAALNHVHIVHIYALGEDEDGPYIVMEYVSGPPETSPHQTPARPHSLADRVHRNGPLSPDDALELMLKICRAIECAHGCGVIHRDLKPSNILIDESGEPKVVDFGLARKTSATDRQLTAPGEKMLSLGYGAPEQESDASTTDERADVYGLGGLLYFMISGQNPRYFREDDVSKSLLAPIVKALKTDRTKRWASVKELREALLVVKTPSTVIIPTAKTAWRCKWCDTVNPMTTQYCGECGWDGGEICAECGAETRVGVQFCGVCGADGRKYETATRLLTQLQTFRDERSFESILQHADRISEFHPEGPSGQRLVKDANNLRAEADESIARREQLREQIKQAMKTENYETARSHIEEYDSLTADAAFSGEFEQIPALTAQRDVRRARRAIENREWDYATRTCRAILDHLVADYAEAKQLLRLIRYHRWRIRIRNGAIAAILVFFAYVFSAAPVYRLLGPTPGRPVRASFSFVALLHDVTLLRTPLAAYARLWGVPDMFAPPGTPPRPSPTTPPNAP